MEELPQVTFRETVTSTVWNYLSLDAGLLHKNWFASCPWEKALLSSEHIWGQKGEGREFKTWKGYTSPLINVNGTHHPPSLLITQKIIQVPGYRLRTSEYLNSSTRFIPSVCRTSSFSPCLLVLSFNKQRVIPFTSWMTVLRATEASREERSKYIFINGSANET